MTHDLNHCTGHLCPIREKCLRYIAFTKVTEDDIDLMNREGKI